MYDYNTLPVGNYRQLKVAAIDGTDSCIMEHGWVTVMIMMIGMIVIMCRFEHLRGLTELQKMVLVNNKYLTDDSVEMLVNYSQVGYGN